jgi:ppGpp synthetase/RelA/SpoT-type nucleotidyltranferase
MNTIDYKQQYQDARPVYEKLTRKLQSLIVDLLESQDIKASVEGRTKEVASFGDKLNRPGKAYTDPLGQMTDLSGIRIILYSISDVDAVAKLVQREFSVDPANSMNKIDLLEPDRFGYLSQHFVIQLGDSRKNLSEWAGLCDLRAEIQVRTVLQHAWAAVEHFLVYKNERDVPKMLRRRLFRLSALFELADEELDDMIHSISDQMRQYRAELAKGNSKIEINVDSLRTYIQSSTEPKYWAQFLRETTGQNVGENDWGDLSRDVRFSIYFDIDSVETLDALLKKAHGWGENFLINYYNDYFERDKVTPDKVSTVINGPVTMLMIASNAEKITADILNKDFGWGLGQILIDHALSARGGGEK